LISLVVVLETERVLRSRYAVFKADMLSTWSALLDAADVAFEDEACLAPDSDNTARLPSGLDDVQGEFIPLHLHRSTPRPLDIVNGLQRCAQPEADGRIGLHRHRQGH
jgi:hypothetical protein